MGPPPEWFKGVGHGEELQYMFDAGTILPSLKGQGLSENDQVFSKRLIRYWTSFAKSGQPDGGEGSVPWKQFDLTGRSYLDIDVTDTQRNNWNKQMYEFWSKELPPLKLDHSYVKSHDEL